MLISIIVPIYNIQPYLCQCIDSILNQTYGKIEVVLVDDGSPDDCPQICDEYAKKDIRIKVVHKKNGGLVSARKAGLKVSEGDYICHVDGDDWLHPNYIESFVNVINKYNPDIICSGEITAYPDVQIESRIPERKGLYTKEQINDEILPSLLEREDGYYFNHSIIQKCIRRDIAVECENLIDDGISMSEDHAFIYPAVLKAQSMYIMENCLYYYRMNPSSMTKAKKSLPWSYPRLMSNHFVDKVGIKGLEDQYCRVMTHILFNTAVSQFNRKATYYEICKDIDENLKHYNKIIKTVYYTSLSRKMSTLSLRCRLYLLLKLYAMKRYR